MNELQLLQEGLNRLPEEQREAIAARFNRQLEAMRKAGEGDQRTGRDPARTRPLGLTRGKGHVPDSFFEPLSDEELDLWNGERADPR